jgi:PPM family protein phosphatase
MNIIRRIFGKSSDEIEDNVNSSSVSTNDKDKLTNTAPNINSGGANPTNEIENNDSSDSSISQQSVEDPDANIPPPVDIHKKPIPAGVTRPLQTEAIAHQQQISLTFGKASDVGMVRENNQDACLALQLVSTSVDERPDFGFFIVADGMGGHHDGEKASAITVETVTAEMLENIYIPMLRNFDDGDRPTIVEALVSASEKANLAVIKKVPDGGTTLTAVAVVGNLAYLAHVGDSRAYLIYNGEIEQLTRDHSLVQRLIELNQLTPEEAEEHPQKNVLYRAIGQNENLEVERLIRPLPQGAQMLICSDGLWGLIGNEKLKEITLDAPTPQDACDKLVALANALGGTDNITAIILKIPSS